MEEGDEMGPIEELIAPPKFVRPYAMIFSIFLFLFLKDLTYSVREVN